MKDYFSLSQRTEAYLGRLLATGRGTCSRAYKRAWQLHRQQCRKAVRQCYDTYHRPSQEKSIVNWQSCPEPRDAGQWITPPRCQGQIVLVSYARGEDGVIYRRTWDQSDGDRGYAKRLLADDEPFEPWQTEPD